VYWYVEVNEGRPEDGHVSPKHVVLDYVKDMKEFVVE
jgi:hypothetical protein